MWPKRKDRLLVLFIAVLGIAVLVAGCGTSSKSPPSPLEQAVDSSRQGALPSDSGGGAPPPKERVAVHKPGQETQSSSEGDDTNQHQQGSVAVRKPGQETQASIDGGDTYQNQQGPVAVDPPDREGHSPTILTTAPPFSVQRSEVDKLIEEAGSPDTKPAAIEKLKAIVQSPDQDPFVKAYVLKRMGDTGLAELETYLLDIASNKFGTDNTRELRWPAYLAYWQLKLSYEAYAVGQLDQLMYALTATFEGLNANNVQTWAAQELCNRGATEQLPAITDSIKNRSAFKRGEDEIRFCEIQMGLLSGHPTRIQALAAALQGEDDFEDLRLYRWAVKETDKIGSQEALLTLADFALKLQNNNGDDLLRAQTIQMLLDNGWTEAQIEEHGIEIVRTLGS